MIKKLKKQRVQKNVCTNKCEDKKITPQGTSDGIYQEVFVEKYCT